MSDKQWWEPIVREDGSLDWLCDHVGDAQEKMDRLWKEIQALRTRPEAAFNEAEARGLLTVAHDMLAGFHDGSQQYEDMRGHFAEQILLFLQGKPLTPREPQSCSERKP